ncbi:nitronate monooxygenase [Halobacillus andaensis]|uniref:Probable nitronate monooxygenase n=1 Tax=Halobacillus andaensis TaxID=1176239 RepID=A0A917B0D5_HALAA|nr:nitronate monooxygenase family protein [Halobacillus andaensis]MBP2003637.1 enoyl-[acyl-carrier protein] reductase II [Halobacillus andaensis]GGF12129.1 nitronate monooxygenase [Halobacillus andaensis]
MKWETRVTDLLDIEYPVIQGGLAHLAYSELASAVSNAGGLGQITAMSMKNEVQLREEIHNVRSLTSKPFGVNFAIGQHGRPFQSMVQAAIDEKVPAISITGGNPQPLLEMVEGTGIKTLVLVAAKRQAIKAEKLGADAVMVVGQEGGGHIGREDVSTFVLTPQVSEAVKIPVIASGGIGDGKGLMAALALGAEGIEMGTRFIATKECGHAHQRYKNALIEADENSTIVIKRSLGAPARALKNQWTEQIVEYEKNQPGYEFLRPYVSGETNKKYIYNGEEHGFGWAGQVAARIHDVPTVNELFERIIKEAESIRTSWS